MKTKNLVGTKRVRVVGDVSALEGRVRVDWAKGGWLVAMLAGSVWGVGWHASWGNALLFAAGSGLTLCAGHSVGLHRLMIHRSFATPLWVERVLVYLGTLVSMGGPYDMLRMHELRDWAQRQRDCHAYFAHRGSLWKDAWEQLFCRCELARPPLLEVEERLERDGFYRFLNRTVYWQQLPWAVALYAWGGLGAALWGVCLRVVVSLVGHWLVNYFAHQDGPRSWEVDDMSLPGANLPVVGFLAMGEGYHNNHHAYPESARMGQGAWEWDPGWWLIEGLRGAGLAWGVRTEGDFPARERTGR